MEDDTLLTLLPPELRGVMSRYCEGPEDFPFTREEMEWLLCQGTLTVLWSAQEVCLVERYAMAQRHKSTQAIANLRVESCTRACFSANSELVRKILSGNDRIHKDKLLDHLIGRHLIEERMTGKIVVATFERKILYADVVLLDAKSIFALLKRRYSTRDTESAARMAARSTLKYVSKIAERYEHLPLIKAMYQIENAAAIEELKTH